MSEGWMRGGAAAVGLLSALMLFPAPALAGDASPSPGGAAVIRQGTALPGSRVEIGPDGPIPPGTTFRWEQVEGPPVPLDDPSAAKIRFVVPEGTRGLAFLLSVRDDRGERTTRVAVPVGVPPVGPQPVASTPAEGPDALPVADGGDDQIGLVGRRITLNGTASRPSGQVGYCWIQLSGPAPSQVREDGGYYSFVPTAAGVHRFALVVGHQSRVSRPALVTVEVGQAPAASATPSDEPSSLARTVAAGVAAIPQGAETASQVADVLESVAERASVYNSVGELQSELARRLDVVIPNAPAVRAAWAGQVFVPLSQYLAAEFSAAGVDPRATSDPPRPLDRAQRERIHTLFRDLAGAFRPQRGRF